MQSWAVMWPSQFVLKQLLCPACTWGAGVVAVVVVVIVVVVLVVVVVVLTRRFLMQASSAQQYLQSEAGGRVARLLQSSGLLCWTLFKQCCWQYWRWHNIAQLKVIHHFQYIRRLSSWLKLALNVRSNPTTSNPKQQTVEFTWIWLSLSTHVIIMSPLWWASNRQCCQRHKQKYFFMVFVD
jgi:hypothetical protein